MGLFPGKFIPVTSRGYPARGLVLLGQCQDRAVGVGVGVGGWGVSGLGQGVGARTGGQF